MVACCHGMNEAGRERAYRAAGKELPRREGRGRQRRVTSGASSSEQEEKKEEAEGARDESQNATEVGRQDGDAGQTPQEVRAEQEKEVRKMVRNAIHIACKLVALQDYRRWQQSREEQMSAELEQQQSEICRHLLILQQTSNATGPEAVQVAEDEITARLSAATGLDRSTVRMVVREAGGNVAEALRLLKKLQQRRESPSRNDGPNPEDPPSGGDGGSGGAGTSGGGGGGGESGPAVSGGGGSTEDNESGRSGGKRKMGGETSSSAPREEALKMAVLALGGARLLGGQGRSRMASSVRSSLISLALLSGRAEAAAEAERMGRRKVAVEEARRAAKVEGAEAKGRWAGKPHPRRQGRRR